MLIQSEIGALKKVLLHRPCYALTRLTPSNCDYYLFDDVLWPEKAVEEHDLFHSLLKKQGVEVLILNDLLKEAIENPEGKNYLIHQSLCKVYHGSEVEELLSQYLHRLNLDEFVMHIFSGVTFKELAPYSLGLISTISNPSDFVIPPLPNQLFMRDSSSWVGQGVCINRMAFAVRQPETAIMSTVYRYHPLFQSQLLPIWYDGDDIYKALPSIEGGDMLVLNEQCLVVGLSQRTQVQAVEILAKKLFQINQVTEIIVVTIPKKRTSMHLDTLLTMVDHDAFCSFYSKLSLHCWSIKPGDREDKIVVEKQGALSETLARILNVDKIRIISPSGDAFALEREQWNDAVNLLAVKPGVVLAYEQNQLTNRALKKAGIEVITFAASELSRGRGGSHCMSCPIEREPLC